MHLYTNFSVELYDRRDDFIIAGLPLQSYSEAASATTYDLEGETDVPSIRNTEKALLQLCNTQLHVNLSPIDISTAHSPKPPPRPKNVGSVIVRFATCKARDLVFRTRFELKKQQSDRICIKEDLPNETSYLFSLARKLCK